MLNNLLQPFLQTIYNFFNFLEPQMLPTALSHFGHALSFFNFPSILGIMQARQKACSHGVIITGLCITLLQLERRQRLMWGLYWLLISSQVTLNRFCSLWQQEETILLMESLFHLFSWFAALW